MVAEERGELRKYKSLFRGTSRDRYSHPSAAVVMSFRLEFDLRLAEI